MDFKEGNCIFNYFYHCFIKFPTKSAIEYHYFDKKINNIYLILKDLNKLKYFQEYFEKLKEYIIKEKGLREKDLNYEFKGLFKKKEIKNNIELGNLIMKFIEVVPIQIAKIKNSSFKAMSNGEDINIRKMYEDQLKSQPKNKKKNVVKISVDKYGNYINFGMKNSILNFYDLPVVVLVFMGEQSIGKSTLANTLIPSFFNVSGLRCTEGIWMSIAAFKGANKQLKKCKNNCKYCENECRLLEHSIDYECVCDKCCCKENCCLYIDANKEKIKNNQNSCNKRCYLPLGHIGNHICEISCFKHGFLCVSLDFEGLGTFERTMEQDIDLSMVGASLGNSIILRVDKTLNSFIKLIMLNWSEISKNLKGHSSINNFGGNLIFCQKDVDKSASNEVKEEFDRQIRESLNEWFKMKTERDSKFNNDMPKVEKINNNFNNQKNFEYFGIFSKYYHAPTPIFNKEDFHDFIRNSLIDKVIKDVLMNKSLPRYLTGNKFMLSLKGILASIDIHEYNLIGDFALENLKSYLIENKEKAIAIFGIYSTEDEINTKSFEEFEKNLNMNLEKLKQSYISNIEQEIIEILHFQIHIDSRKNIIKKSEFSRLKINLSQNKNISDYEIEIDGLEEFGLLLFIPDEYKDKFTLEDIRIKLFILWKQICQNLEINRNSDIINNFGNFVEAIIERRENNIKKWLENLTLSFKDKDIGKLKKIDSLKDKWQICKELCSKCFLKCTKIIGHKNEHNCGFNHKCQEFCKICKTNKIKCNNYEECEKMCDEKAGHKTENHKCSHFHKCTEKCENKKLRNCNKLCSLQYGHKEKHICDSESHLCDQYCQYEKESNCKELCKYDFGHIGPHKCTKETHKCQCNCFCKNKSRGCLNKGICKYNLPHEGNHDCGGKHLCPKKCAKINLSGCQELCQLEFGHSKNIPHNCLYIHYCGKPCQFNQKNGPCSHICSLKDDHKEMHDCKNIHYCLKDCYYKNKSRGCKGKCILILNHKGKCLCDSNEHLCNNTCSKKNCEKKCNLVSEHEDNNHNCKGFHKCTKPCYLKEITLEGKCELECCLELDHDGFCLCSKKKEEHSCRNTCINCGKRCTLEAGHKKSCFCGQCICGKECIYKNNSRNCKEKCKLKFNHDGEHICEEIAHLCNYDCQYKNKTATNGGCNHKCCLKAGHEGINHYCENPKEKHKCRNICSYKDISSINSCKVYCDKSIDHSPPCICKIAKDNHICNKACSYQNFEGCKIFFFFLFEHNGECICLAKKEGHLCGKECSYIKARIGCNLKCILSLGHSNELKCICSFSEKEHLCNGICQNYENARKGCLKFCKFSISEEHNCSCNNPIDNHICKSFCSLKDLSFEGTCKDYCIKKINHSGNCMCSSKKHKCKMSCKYKDSSRAGCLEKCSKEPGHTGEHLCENPVEKHKCKEFCFLKNVSRKKNKHYCEKIALHEGEHLCNLEKDAHKCNSKCSIIDCKENCDKIAGHEDKEHYCKNGHKCSLLCHLSKARLCNSNCVLKYGHEKLGQACLCDIKENEHLCPEKCTLCYNYCALSYNHNGEHICSEVHKCSEECGHKGYCLIECNAIFQEKKIYHLIDNSEDIEYTLKGGEQIPKKKKCIIPIEAGLLKHEGEHRCDIENDKHKCKYRCLQCDRICDLDYGHELKNIKHFCYIHNQITNCLIQTEEDILSIKYYGKEIHVKNEEKAIIYDCKQYCKDQGRGHIHRLDKNQIPDLKDNLKNKNIRKSEKIEDDTYDCKCKFYWESFLKFGFDLQFQGEDLLTNFDLCPAKCPLCDSDQNTFCSEKLWHESLKSGDNKDAKFWISLDGHKFKCKHKTPCYTIFIVDTSKSMTRNDITPNASFSQNDEKFKNRLGSVLEVISKYISIRNNINSEDIFSLVTFNCEAKIIFDEINLIRDKINISSECKNRIGEVQKGTCYRKGLFEASKLLGKMDRKKYKPIIILLTDGHDEDGKEKETLEKIDEVSIFYFILFIIVNENK